MRMAINWAILLLIALAFTVAPGGDATLNVILTVLTVAFFVAIALLGARLYREHRFTLDSLETAERIVLYGSVGLAFLTFVATPRLFHGVGVLVWLALLGMASFGVYWVFTHSRGYG